MTRVVIAGNSEHSGKIGNAVFIGSGASYNDDKFQVITDDGEKIIAPRNFLVWHKDVDEEEFNLLTGASNPVEYNELGEPVQIGRKMADSAKGLLKGYVLLGSLFLSDRDSDLIDKTFEDNGYNIVKVNSQFTLKFMLDLFMQVEPDVVVGIDNWRDDPRQKRIAILAEGLGIPVKTVCPLSRKFMLNVADIIMKDNMSNYPCFDHDN